MEPPTKSRARRQHSPELKRQVVDEWRQPGAGWRTQVWYRPVGDRFPKPI